MAKIKYFAAALVFIVCVGSVAVNNANAANTIEKNAPAAHTGDALVTLEKSAYAAWKSKDAKFWDTFLSEKFVGWGSSGRLDKASATKEYAGAECEVKRLSLFGPQMKPTESVMRH